MKLHSLTQCSYRHEAQYNTKPNEIYHKLIISIQIKAKNVHENTYNIFIINTVFK